MTEPDKIWDELHPYEKEALERAETKFRKGLEIDNPYASLALKAQKPIKGTLFACYQDGSKLHFFSEKNRFRALIQMAEQIWLPDWPDFCRLACMVDQKEPNELSDDETWELESFGFRLEGDTISLGHHGVPGPTSMFLSPTLFYKFIEFVNDNLKNESEYTNYIDSNLNERVTKWEQYDDAKKQV